MGVHLSNPGLEFRWAVSSQLPFRFYWFDSTSITTATVQPALILKQSRRRNPGIGKAKTPTFLALSARWSGAQIRLSPPSERTYLSESEELAGSWREFGLSIESTPVKVETGPAGMLFRAPETVSRTLVQSPG